MIRRKITANHDDNPQKILRDLTDLSLQQQENLKTQIQEWRDQSFPYQGTSVVLRKWTAQEYDAMLEHEILTEKDRVELVNGQIIQMSPITPPHAAATKRSYDYLMSVLLGQAAIRSQVPVVLNDDSKPEPDIAVVKLEGREYSDRHPTADDVFLIIEISDATLFFDLNEKALAYAKSGIEDYWVVDIRLRQVHIMRQPVGEAYMQKKTFKLVREMSFETPLALPQIQVSLLNLLPLG